MYKMIIQKKFKNMGETIVRESLRTLNIHRKKIFRVHTKSSHIILLASIISDPNFCLLVVGFYNKCRSIKQNFVSFFVCKGKNSSNHSEVKE